VAIDKNIFGRRKTYNDKSKTCFQIKNIIMRAKLEVVSGKTLYDETSNVCDISSMIEIHSNLIIFNC